MKVPRDTKEPLTISEVKKIFRVLNLVVIKNEHKIVKSGLYKYLRHPSYTGFILILIGIPLSLKLLTATLLVTVVTLTIFGFRIHVEEKELLSNFKDEYRTYSEHTWKIIPFIW